MKCSIYILDPSNSAHLYLLHTNRRSTIEPLQSDTTISVNTKHTGPSTLIKASPLQVCFFLQHLEDSPNLKRHVIKHLKHLDAPIIVHTILPSYKTLDYAWNDINEQQFYTKIELDYLISWLSTLGGGYSALGDYFNDCADIAGRISMYQMQLALKFGDPTLIARSKLYIAIALIQKNRLREAKHIIRRQFHESVNDPEADGRLANMCRGIWLKLQYSYTIRGKVLVAKR